MAKKEDVIKELKEAIKDEELSVADLFSSDEILVSKPVKKAIDDEQAHTARIEKKLGEEREKIVTLTREKETTDTKVKALTMQVNSTQTKTMFDTIATARKLNDKEKTYIEKHISTFRSDKTGDDFKQDFDRFIDKELKDFEDTATLLGVKKPAAGATGGGAASAGAGAAGGAGAGSGDGQGGEAEDLTDPKNNDMIPT